MSKFIINFIILIVSLFVMSLCITQMYITKESEQEVTLWVGTLTTFGMIVSIFSTAASFFKLLEEWQKQ